MAAKKKRNNNKNKNSKKTNSKEGGSTSTPPTTPSMTMTTTTTGTSVAATEPATDGAETLEMMEMDIDPAAAAAAGGTTDGGATDANHDIDGAEITTPATSTTTAGTATEDQPATAESTTTEATDEKDTKDAEEKDNGATTEVEHKEEERNVVKEDNDEVEKEKLELQENGGDKDHDHSSTADVESAPVLKMEKSTDDESDDLEEQDEGEDLTKQQQQQQTETEKVAEEGGTQIDSPTSVGKEDNEDKQQQQQQQPSTSVSSTTTPAVTPTKEDGSFDNDLASSSEQQKTEDVSEETSQPQPLEEEEEEDDKHDATVDAVPSDEGGTNASDVVAVEETQEQTKQDSSGEDGTESAVKPPHDEVKQQEPKVEASAETAAETLLVSEGSGEEQQQSEPDGIKGVPSDEEGHPVPEDVEEEKPSEPNVPPPEKVVAPPRPRPTGLTFAAAFGDSPPESAVSPLASPTENTPKTAPTRIETSRGTPPSDNDVKSPSTTTSGGALSASRNKKVSDRISKYVEKVAHEPLPGDAVIKRTNSNPSTLNPKMYSPKPSPQSLQVPRKMLQVDSENLPDMKSVREMFEESSKNSEKTDFEFGEEFRQKKRYEQLSGKAQEREAKMSMRGFDEVEFFQGRTASGEVDTSSLGKIFTFELSSNESISLPDGMCRVNYKKIDYKAMVFVVHRTRGMLLLHVAMPGGDNASREIPGGSVNEDEFLRAAQQSGSSHVQLQIAAREAAARQVYEKTGLDIRDDVDRFKPAILKMYTQVDARGVQYPKNEHANKLYYFLQVDDDDFEALAASSNGHHEGGEPTKLVRPSEDPGDSPLALKLGQDYADFTFVQDPIAAAKVLKKGGDSEVTTALQMIMTEAEKDGAPDAKASEYSPKGDSVADSTPVDEKTGHLVRTVGLQDDDEEKKVDSHGEADIKHKPSQDTVDAAAEVQCCCGWW